MAYYGDTRRNYKKRKKVKKQDWHRSEFNNPYFDHQEPINLKPYVYFFIFSGFFLTLGYFLLFSPYLKIKSVEIVGDKYTNQATEITNQYLKENVFNLLSRDNYFIFDSGELINKLSGQLLFKKIEVKKILPDKINIIFNEIKPVYILIQANRFFYIDNDGLVGEEISGSLGSDRELSVADITSTLISSNAKINLPIIHNEHSTPINSRDNINDKDFLKLVTKLHYQIPAIVKSDIILYKVKNSNFKKIEAVTEDGWVINFNDDDDIDNQIKNLNSVMQTEYKDSKPKEYIDLRYGNKLYYK